MPDILAFREWPWNVAFSPTRDVDFYRRRAQKP